jgi:hypothetical protein
VITWQGRQHFATAPPPQPPAIGEAARSDEERLAHAQPHLAPDGSVDAACRTYHRAGVRLVLMDEVHRLKPARKPPALLKDLTERIRATFVYAGIDVTHTALFSGVRGAQLDARASLVECGAFPGTPPTFTSGPQAGSGA